MVFSRRGVIAAGAALYGGAFATGARAQAQPQALPKPFVVYDDEFKNGWVSFGWAKIEIGVAAGGVKPIKVQGDPWTALFLHHDAFSTEGFSKLTFYINGGVDGGQNLAVKALADGKAIDSNYLIQPKLKSWNIVEVPLKDIGAAGKTIDGLWWQGQADAYKPYYITKIQFE
jgi:hypothetical protein